MTGHSGRHARLAARAGHRDGLAQPQLACDKKPPLMAEPGPAGRRTLLAGVGGIARRRARGRRLITRSRAPDKAATEAVVRDYILRSWRDPAAGGRAACSSAQPRAAVGASIARRSRRRSHGAWAGAANGDVVLVEFFDYACPYCRASNADVDRLLREDPQLKVVWRELPILGPDSEAAANVSLAAAAPGPLPPFHDAHVRARPADRDGRRRRRARGTGVAARGRRPRRPRDELARNFDLARAARRHRHADLRGRRPGAARARSAMTR